MKKAQFEYIFRFFRLLSDWYNKRLEPVILEMLIRAETSRQAKKVRVIMTKVNLTVSRVSLKTKQVLKDRANRLAQSAGPVLRKLAAQFSATVSRVSLKTKQVLKDRANRLAQSAGPVLRKLAAQFSVTVSRVSLKTKQVLKDRVNRLAQSARPALRKLAAQFSATVSRVSLKAKQTLKERTNRLAQGAKPVLSKIVFKMSGTVSRVKTSQLVQKLGPVCSSIVFYLKDATDRLAQKTKPVLSKIYFAVKSKAIPSLRAQTERLAQRMKPVLTKFITRMFGLPKNISLKSLRAISWKSPKVISGVSAVILVFAGIGVYFNGTAPAFYIYVNEQKVGIVPSEEKGQELAGNVLIKRGQAVNQVARTHDILTYEKVRVKKVALLEAVNTERELQRTLTSYIEGCSLGIAGETLFILPSEADAVRLLTAYQDYYTKPSESNKVQSVEYGEQVSLTPVEVQPEQVKLYDEAYEEFMYGRTITTEYIAQKNDSWWLIARKNNMLTKEVLAGNPGMTEESTVREGMIVNLVSVSPYLTVKSTGVLTTTEAIKYDVITKTDIDLGIGKTVVKEEGSDGSKIVTYAYSQVNGENVERRVLSETITKEPVARVVSKGPELTAVALERAVSRGTSTGMGWPLSGSINSYYGYRSGGFHNGLDIGGGTGTPYYASAAGRVVTAGWSGGYGYMILLDHGNGIMTRYAHSSKLLVSEGQQVSQGQNIGLVGSTGNSTGAHLHFEVILNGSAVNPTNYIN